MYDSQENTQRNKSPRLYRLPHNITAVKIVNGKQQTFWSRATTEKTALGKFILLSGSDDGIIKVWRFVNGDKIKKCTQILHDHVYPVKFLAVLPASSEFLSASVDGAIKIWDLHELKCIRSLQLADKKAALLYLNCLLLMPSSPTNHFQSCSTCDSGVSVWDLNNGAQINRLSGHTRSVKCLARSSTGRLISGSMDCTIRIWDPRNGQCEAILCGHTKSVECISILSDKDTLASGSEDKSVKIWNLGTLECVKTLKGHSGTVSCLLFLALRDELLSGSYDSTIKVWNLTSGACLRTLQGHTSFVECVTLLPCGGQFASGSYDATIRIWNLSSGLCLKTIYTEKYLTNLSTTLASGVNCLACKLI